jgi:hypothetical protein
MGVGLSSKLLFKLGKYIVFDIHPKKLNLSAFYAPTLRVSKDLITAFGNTKYLRSNTNGWVEKRITPPNKATRQRAKM